MCYYSFLHWALFVNLKGGHSREEIQKSDCILDYQRMLIFYFYFFIKLAKHFVNILFSWLTLPVSCLLIKIQEIWRLKRKRKKEIVSSQKKLFKNPKHSIYYILERNRNASNCAYAGKIWDEEYWRYYILSFRISISISFLSGTYERYDSKSKKIKTLSAQGLRTSHPIHFALI